MRTIVHHRNYLIRYVLSFLGAAIFCFITPQWLPWPLRISCVFVLLMLSLLARTGRRLIGTTTLQSSAQLWQQTMRLWGWQSIAVLYWLCLLNINHSVLHAPSVSLSNTWFAIDSISKLPLLAMVTTTLAYVSYRTHRPLALVAFFPNGANALTRLVIFGHAWLRDATTTICLFGLSASASYLLAQLPWVSTPPTAIVIISFLITACLIKSRTVQRTLRHLATRRGFGSTVLIITVVFAVVFVLLHTLFSSWGIVDFRLPKCLYFMDAYTLSQCLGILIIAPLAFKTATYCHGLSIRQAIVRQCLNPFILLGLLAYYSFPLRYLWLSSDHACLLMAIFTLIASLYYGNSVWFASMTERCFADCGHLHQGPLRWFFNQLLQRIFLLWLLIMQLGIGSMAMVFLGGIAVGLMIVYSYFYGLFWERLRDESQCL